MVAHRPPKHYYAAMHADHESIPSAVQAAAQEVHRELYRLQWDQFRHDESYHREIARLPMPERIKHLVLHLAKYAGGLAEAIESGNEDKAEKSLLDAFIISMSLANVLNIRLDASLTVEDFFLASGRHANSPYDFLTQYVMAVGRASKAIESLDHVELYPCRDELNRATVECVALTAKECLRRGVSISNAVADRLHGVKRKSIFYDMIVAKDDGH